MNRGISLLSLFFVAIVFVMQTLDASTLGGGGSDSGGSKRRVNKEKLTCDLQNAAIAMLAKPFADDCDFYGNEPKKYIHPKRHKFSKKLKIDRFYLKNSNLQANN